MTTQHDHPELEQELTDIKTLMGENALMQSRILNKLNEVIERLDQIDHRIGRLEDRVDGLDQRLDRLEHQVDALSRHLGVPPRNGTG